MCGAVRCPGGWGWRGCAGGTSGGWAGSSRLAVSLQGQGTQGMEQGSCLCTESGTGVALVVAQGWERFLLEGQDRCPGPVSERLWPLDEALARGPVGGCVFPPSTPRVAPDAPAPEAQ